VSRRNLFDYQIPKTIKAIIEPTLRTVQPRTREVKQTTHERAKAVILNVIAETKAMAVMIGAGETVLKEVEET
jgi:hypothetical protein